MGGLQFRVAGEERADNGLILVVQIVDRGLERRRSRPSSQLDRVARRNREDAGI